MVCGLFTDSRQLRVPPVYDPGRGQTVLVLGKL